MMPKNIRDRSEKPPKAMTRSWDIWIYYDTRSTVYKRITGFAEMVRFFQQEMAMGDEPTDILIEEVK
jgi:hypothetical protein